MHEETWIKAYCPECKTQNWICEGDMQDMTTPDTEAIKCWNCGHSWWRDPDTAKDMHENPDEALEDCAEEGQSDPD